MLIRVRRPRVATLQAPLYRFLVLACLILAAFAGRANAAIAFVQANSATPQTSQTTVTVTYTSAQTAGNLNVVAVGWNDSTATISSVMDSAGNAYAVAAAAVVQSGTASQAIYYAKNIVSAAAGANTVTVTFSVAAVAVDVRIAEYSGLDTVNPLDVSAGAQGTTTSTSNSGSVTTTNANDLLVGANVVQSVTTGPGAGYTSRVITSDGDILEDQVVTVAGSYSATATLDKLQPWIMQMVAFRAASTGSVPSISGLSPTNGPIGTSVTISGSNFGTSQGTSKVTFNGTIGTPTSWGTTSIVVPVPSGANSGNVVVTVGGVASNGVYFTVGTVSAIAFVQTNSGTFANSVTSAAVAFTGAQAAGDLIVVVAGWNDSTAAVSSVTDTVGNAYALAVGPTVQTNTATQSIYYAKNIGAAAAGANTVTVTFSTAAFHPDIRIAEYSGLDPQNPFDVGVAAQNTTTATSDSGPATTTNANDLLVGANTVQSTTTAAGAGYNSRVITVFGDILEDQTVSATGSYDATAALDKVQPWIMQIAAFRAAVSGGGTVPNIATLNPTSGPVGTPVTISGSNFGGSQGSSTVKFNGITATPSSWGATSILVPVPNGATSGAVVVTVGGVASNSVNFAVTSSGPSITSLSQNSGPVGTPITITGTNFGASQGTSTVTFSGTAGTPTSWGTTSIVVPVPTGAMTGSVVVTVGGVASNGMTFTVTPPAPTITSLSQNSGPVGTPITITGTNFGASQGTSTVTFSGTAGTPTSWGTTSIVVPVPTGAMTGNVIVTVGGVASNSMNFTVTAASAGIALVQHTSKDGGITTSSSLAFPSNNSAGNFIAVAIRAGHSGQALTVTDTRGNSYKQAVLLNQTADAPSGDTLAIFYAENITAGANTVTVSDSISNNTLRFAILEYSGVVKANSVDGTAAAQGNGVSASSGNATTTAAGDLVLGAVMSADGETFTAGSGFTIEERVPTAPNSKLIAEDQIQNAAGTVAATATQSASASWGAAAAAFKAASGGVAGPIINTLTPNSGPVGTSVTIAGMNFGTSRGSSTVTFSGTAATPTNWTATSIAVPVPSGAMTGSVVVTVGGTASNGVTFTVTAPAPTITGLNPNSGTVGTSVTIAGANFGASQGTSTLTFSGIATTPTSWSTSSIAAPVPAGAMTGSVVVTVGGQSSNGASFTVTNPGPSISGLNPASGPVGTSVTISGSNFGTSQGTSTVTFSGTTTTPTNWTPTSISAPVPSGAMSGNVVVTVGGVASNGVSFTVTTGNGGIKLAQHIGKDFGTSNSASLAFPSNNAAGNWIGVAIRAGKSGQTLAVSDSLHNTYKQAVLFNMTVDAETIAIFYAENIAGGANTVTVSDNLAGGSMRVSILEYSGVALSNSLDNSTAAEGTNANPNSGNTITAWGGDLLLGDITTADPETYTAGSGYMLEDAVPAAGTSKLVSEDQIQAAAGAVAATATLGASDPWGAAIAAFKAANGIPPAPITVTVSPSSATVGSGSGTQAFTAALTNDVQGKGATWSLSGAGCSGTTCGSLTNVTSTSVTYNGPPSVPSPATVTLTATSVTDNTKTGTATITVVAGAISVSVSPKRGSTTTSQTQQFTATVFNDPSNKGVTWQVDGNNGGNSTSGRISTTGLFTPGTQPGLHTITAISVANASASASVSFAVTDLQGVYTYHNDVARTGQNLKEYALTTSTVNSTTFTQLFSCPVDGYVYAQPLYVANLTINSATHNVIFIATEHDSVYAFDADSLSCVQFWKTSFLGPGVTTMPWQDTASSTIAAANDVFPEIGITSTPVIDPATGTIYAEAKTKETVGAGCSTGSPCYVHRLHALSITTGAEKFGGPVVITAANFVSLRHFNRPALLLANNTVYIGFGSHGDIGPWYGWLFGYDPATLAQKFVFPTSDPTSGGSTGNGASLWNGGDGPAADSSGNVYIVTGNGTYDGKKNFSESVMKLSPTAAILDWFTPFNGSTFDANDIDMGSAGPVILPDSVGSAAHQHLLLATGKVAILYLLDQTNMGKFTSGSNKDVQEVIPVPPPNTTQFDGGNYGVTAYWNGNIYSTGQSFPLSQFTIANGVIATPQHATSSNTFPPRGAVPSVSANGTTNGIVWVLDLSGWSNGTPTPGILYAYDATNVANVLYTSPASGSGASAAAVKFSTPTVANGKVYIGGQSSFVVFGLSPN